MNKLTGDFIYYIFKIFFFRDFNIKIKNLKNIPKNQGFIIASNHNHSWDPTLISIGIKKHIHFLAIHSIFTRRLSTNNWLNNLERIIFKDSFAGFNLRFFQQIPVSYSNKSMNRKAFLKASYYLKKRKIIGIFPEGELNLNKKKIYPGMVIIAKTNNVKILPIHIWTNAPSDSFLKPNFTKVKINIGKPVNFSKAINNTKNLVVCTYPTRDLDRLLSFYNAVKSTGRDLVIDTKQAYLLELFQTSEEWKNFYPSPTDDNIKVFVSRKSWGLLDKDPEVWTEKIIQADYKNWERGFLDYPNYVDYRDIMANQKNFVFYCSDFQLQNLIDVKPKEESSYIRSSTEPFNDEMELDQERIQRWLIHFGLISKIGAWNTIHVSGHGTGDQIKKIVDDTDSKTLIPIHTEHADLFDSMHENVQKVNLNDTVQVA